MAPGSTSYDNQSMAVKNNNASAVGWRPGCRVLACVQGVPRTKKCVVVNLFFGASG